MTGAKIEITAPSSSAGDDAEDRRKAAASVDKVKSVDDVEEGGSDDGGSAAANNGGSSFPALEWLLEPGTFKLKPEMRVVTAKSLLKWFRQNLLLVVTFSGVSIGVIAGLAMRPLELEKETVSLIAYPGELFMRLLRLMILPLIIASLITGAASLNAKMNGMIALRTIVYFLCTSLISSLIGLALVLTIHPGSIETKEKLGDGDTEERKIDMVDNFMDLGRNLFPDNLFKAAFQTAQTTYDVEMVVDEKTNATTEEIARVLTYRSGTNTLGVIFFCLTFGTVLGSIGTHGEPVVRFFAIIDEVIMKMVYGIMWASPVGIGSVICAKILSVPQLSLVMSQLALFIVTVVTGIFLYQFTVLQLIYLVIVKKNPYKFWWGCFQSWMTAFATASTAAALPVTFSCMEYNNKIDKRISKFVLPIGATVNMDGTALFVTVASIFIAQMNDIPLDAGNIITVVLTSTATSIAAASVPSAALVLMLLVLTAIDAPYQDVSLLWAIDWFVDRCRTTNNLLGDCYGAAVVEALSKKDLAKMDEEKEELRKAKLKEAEAAEAEAAAKFSAAVAAATAASTTSVVGLANACNGSKNADLENAQGVLRANWNQVTKDDEELTNVSGMDSPCGSSVNGSSVEVPDVIVVDNDRNGDGGDGLHMDN